MTRRRTQSDYFRMNNNIFDTETDGSGHTTAKLSAIQMRVLAALYSLAPFDSYRVKVRQSVLAEKCGCSVSTIKRAVAVLIEKHYIKSAARDVIYAEDVKLLGTYTYTLPSIAKKGFFYVSRKALAILDKLQTRVYLFLCKCSRKTMDCWNSFSDIANKLSLQRNAVVKTIRELVEKKVINRTRNKKKDGSFNDNSYEIEDVETNRLCEAFIADFFSGSENECVIVPLAKENGCCATNTTAEKPLCKKKHSKHYIVISLHRVWKNVNSFRKISCGFFYFSDRVP